MLAPSGRMGMFGMSGAATRKTHSTGALLTAAVRTPQRRFTPVTFMSRNERAFGMNRGHLWAEVTLPRGWLDALLEAYVRGWIRPIVAARFPLERAAEAQRYLQECRNFGKVLLVAD